MGKIMADDVFQFINIARRDGDKKAADVRRQEFREIYAPFGAEQAGEQVEGQRGQGLEEIAIDHLTVEQAARFDQEVALVRPADGEGIAEEVQERGAGDGDGKPGDAAAHVPVEVAQVPAGPQSAAGRRVAIAA